MSEHTATVHWQRHAHEVFSDNRYHRRHDWRFDGGAVVPGSSSPRRCRCRGPTPAAVDPEEAFVASLSSCHLLWFLHLAGKAGWVVDDYQDDAVGVMARRPDGRLAVTTVTLRPVVRFAGTQPTAEQHETLHHDAHAQCFIANSVTSELRCEPTLAR
jgi:organic hydroperoxide reductase OsmC/OhrA